MKNKKQSTKQESKSTNKHPGEPIFGASARQSMRLSLSMVANRLECAAPRLSFGSSHSTGKRCAEDMPIFFVERVSFLFEGYPFFEG